MKEPKNYSKAKEVTDFRKLPPGGYVCTIVNVEERTSRNDTKFLALAYDINEGEFKDYWRENYANQTSEDKKWKGNFFMSCPDEDAEEDDWKLRFFKTNMHKFEDSNNGFHWDWDEQKLKGLKIGMLIREEEYSWNGNTGMSSKAYSLITVDDARKGNFETPKPKYLDDSAQNNNSTPPADNSFVNVPDNADDGGFPFNF